MTNTSQRAKSIISNLDFFSFSELYKQPGKIALLTGGNRGIGLRIVKKLVECDIEVILGKLVLERGRFYPPNFVGVAPFSTVTLDPKIKKQQSLTFIFRFFLTTFSPTNWKTLKTHKKMMKNNRCPQSGRVEKSRRKVSGARQGDGGEAAL